MSGPVKSSKMFTMYINPRVLRAPMVAIIIYNKASDRSFYRGMSTDVQGALTIQTYRYNYRDPSEYMMFILHKIAMNIKYNFIQNCKRILQINTLYINKPSFSGHHPPENSIECDMEYKFQSGHHHPSDTLAPTHI